MSEPTDAAARPVRSWPWGTAVAALLLGAVVGASGGQGPQEASDSTVFVLPASIPTVAAPAPGEVVYADCDDVRARGAAPIRPGDPGWQPRFDLDDDGVGCEI
jgi:hypothetical protein